jgi:hypothetical protein
LPVQQGIGLNLSNKKRYSNNIQSRTTIFRQKKTVTPVKASPLFFTVSNGYKPKITAATILVRTDDGHGHQTRLRRS